jgi:hypothetical protein
VILIRLIRLLSSWRLTAAIALGFLTAYLYFIFGENPFKDWLNFIFKKPGGLLLYGGLMANLVCASIRAAMAKLGSESVSPESIKKMDAWIEVPHPGPDPIGAAAESIRKMGFAVEESPTTASAQKGRYSFLPGTVLRAGIVILMASALLSTNLRRAEEAVFYEGGEAELLDRVFGLSEIRPDLPEDFIQVGQESSFRLDTISATLSASDREYTVTSGIPLNAAGLYLRITHLGIMQPISGRTPSTVFDWDVFLDVLPPGRTDSETLLSNDLSLAFTLMPSKTIEKGLVTGRLYDLKEPLYKLAIISTGSGERPENVTVSHSKSASVGDVDITLGENSVYVRVQAVDDPTLPWLYAGVIILIAGAALMLSRFFWYEKRACAFRTYDELLVGYSEEFYKKWGILKFQKLREELLNQGRNLE